MPAWGVFITTPRERHVMPVDHEGYAIDAHVPQLWCWCRPRLDPTRSMTAVTNLQAGINSSGTAIGTLGSYADFETAANIMTATSSPILVSPMFRESLASTTAEYAVADAIFTASTMNEAGDFRCRRVR